MTDLVVARWKRVYRLPGDAAGERARLDRILASAVDESLFDAALDRAGMPAGEEICLRNVEAFARLDPSEPDWRLGVDLSIVLADAIAARLRDAGPDIVRFRSRRHALVDMACRAARGDLARAWAWRQLGVWPASDVLSVSAARAGIIDALLSDAAAAPAVLAAVSRAGLVAALIASVPVERWIALARASLVAAEADAMVVASIELALQRGGGIGPEPGAESLAPEHAAAVARLVARSEILRGTSRTMQGIEAPLARALTLLAVIECEPDLARRPWVSTLVTEVAVRLSDRASAPRAAARANQPESTAEARAIEQPERQHEGTDHGGLLFLLHVVRALELPETIAEAPALAARGLRWTMHQLAQMLCAVTESDPAALAFAGLAPGTRSPADREPPPTEGERVILARLVSAICTGLRERGLALPDEADRELLDRVTARHTEIYADPAWIEARFRLADVTTDVRRAGLDLDPGWIPWLGVVVRFTYE